MEMGKILPFKRPAKKGAEKELVWGHCSRCGETHNGAGEKEWCEKVAAYPRCWHGRHGWCESCASQ